MYAVIPPKAPKEEFPVSVDLEILTNIVAWCEHHVGDKPPPEEGNKSEKELEEDAYYRRMEEVPEWDRNFLAERGYSGATTESREKFAAFLLVRKHRAYFLVYCLA
jgi:hypothetical protein